MPSQPSDETLDTYPAPIAIIFPALAALSCLICICPLILQVRARSIPLITLIAGVIVFDVFSFTNAVIWHDEIRAVDKWWKGQVLCDIEIKLYLGIGMAISGVPPSISRQLSGILDMNRMSPTPSRGRRRRQIIFEVVFCVIIPLYVMAIDYLCQAYRYKINGFVGCRELLKVGWVTVGLIWIWYIVYCIVGLFYGLLTATRLIQYRRSITSLLNNSQSGTNRAQFIRLAVITSFLTLGYAPIAIHDFATGLTDTLYRHHDPTNSWQYLRTYDWSHRIILVRSLGVVPLDRWGSIVLGLIISLVFGSGSEARLLYHDWAMRLGICRLLEACKGWQPARCLRLPWFPSIGLKRKTRDAVVNDTVQVLVPYELESLSPITRTTTMITVTSSAPVPIPTRLDSN